jgi:hypothetical protein
VDLEFKHDADLVRPAPSVAGSIDGAPGRPLSGLEQTASGIGNRYFTQFVARMRDGDGILPGGRVHPDWSLPSPRRAVTARSSMRAWRGIWGRRSANLWTTSGFIPMSTQPRSPRRVRAGLHRQ